MMGGWTSAGGFWMPLFCDYLHLDMCKSLAGFVTCIVAAAFLQLVLPFYPTQGCNLLYATKHTPSYNWRLFYWLSCRTCTNTSRKLASQFFTFSSPLLSFLMSETAQCYRQLYVKIFESNIVSTPYWIKSKPFLTELGHNTSDKLLRKHKAIVGRF